MVATQELFPQSGGHRGKAGKQVLPDGASAHAGLVSGWKVAIAMTIMVGSWV